MIALILALAIGIPILWICGDLVYSLLMKRSYARWEAGIERDSDGVRLGCRDFTLGHGNTALLLVHGFGDSPALYQRMAPVLAARGFTCRAMRLPNFAMPMHQYRLSSAAQWCQAVEAEVRTLRQSHTRVVVVGHSLGAAVAIACVADHPDAVDGLVLLTPLIAVSNQRSPLLSAHAWYWLLDRTLIFTDSVRMIFPPDLGDPESVGGLKVDQFMPRSIYRELFALLARNRHRASDLHVPLLMVLSRGDCIVDNNAAERFFVEYAGPVKRLQHVHGVGHVIPLDSGWEMLVEGIGQFVAELPERTATTLPD